MIELLVHVLLTRRDGKEQRSRTIHVGVRCEECGSKFGYALSRSLEAEVSRMVWESRSQARKSASGRAKRLLDRKLEHAHDTVPCPQCGRIQKCMIRAARAERFQHTRPRGLVTALVLGIVAVVLLTLLSLIQLLVPGIDLYDVCWGLGISVPVFAVCGGLSLAAHEVRVRTYDPNSTPVEDRIERGRERSLTWEEFQELYPEEDDEEDEE